MIQIKAAVRLQIIAKASEDQARKYLQSLGVKVGQLMYSINGRIGFMVEGNKNEAKRNLDKALGAPHAGPGKDFFKYDLGNGRQVIYKFKDIGANVRGPVIYLVDTKDAGPGFYDTGLPPGATSKPKIGPRTH